MLIRIEELGCSFSPLHETSTPLLISEVYSYIYLFYLFKDASRTLVNTASNYRVIRKR